MITLILTIHIILACCIICAVLLQKSEGGGLGIGGSGGGFMTARGTANFMTKLTAFLDPRTEIAPARAIALSVTSTSP